MTQPTFTQVRAALAAQLATIPGLRTSASRNAEISPPIAVIMPVTGTFIRYNATFDGSVDITLRAILLVSQGDSTSGQDLLDTYLAATGPSSLQAALQADSTLGGVVQDANIAEVTGYGLMSWAGIDYLAAHAIVNVMI